MITSPIFTGALMVSSAVSSIALRSSPLGWAYLCEPAAAGVRPLPLAQWWLRCAQEQCALDGVGLALGQRFPETDMICPFSSSSRLTLQLIGQTVQTRLLCTLFSLLPVFHLDNKGISSEVLELLGVSLMFSISLGLTERSRTVLTPYIYDYIILGPLDPQEELYRFGEGNLVGYYVADVIPCNHLHPLLWLLKGAHGVAPCVLPCPFCFLGDVIYQVVNVEDVPAGENPRNGGHEMLIHVRTVSYWIA